MTVSRISLRSRTIPVSATYTAASQNAWCSRATSAAHAEGQTVGRWSRPGGDRTRCWCSGIRSSGGAYLPIVNGLARAGHHVICCNSRYRGTDSALLMEKVVEDLGACIKDARRSTRLRRRSCSQVSGGGSLAAFYQQQAQHATVTSSPSGDGL